jgi:hypothetical protein
MGLRRRRLTPGPAFAPQSFGRTSSNATGGPFSSASSSGSSHRSDAAAGARGELRCELDGERTHDRCAGVCYLNGTDIAQVMVRQGLARDCPRFSGGRYAAAEPQAAAGGRRSRQATRCRGTARPGDRRLLALALAARVRLDAVAPRVGHHDHAQVGVAAPGYNPKAATPTRLDSDRLGVLHTQATLQ